MTADSEPISISLWEDPVTRMCSEILRAKQAETRISQSDSDPNLALQALENGEVDVAILPTSTVISVLDRLDVLPSVGISSFSNPFATLTVDAINASHVNLLVESGREVHASVAEIILKEQYNCVADRIQASMSAGIETIRIQHLAESPEHGFRLDLGREWYELVSYPFVWSLFVTLRDKATPRIIRCIRESVSHVEAERLNWVRDSKHSQAESKFYAESIRYRMDDLAVASLTEYCEFMYFYGHVGDIPKLAFAGEPDESESET